MKHGRIIKLKTESLRKIRTNLRKLFLAAVDNQFNRLMDQGYVQSSMDNYIGVQKIDRKIHSYHDLSYFSICKCCDCKSIEKDAVFWSDEINFQFFYPPLSESEKAEMENLTYWLCPDCYEERMKRVEENIKEKVYDFREYGFCGSLKELGIDKVEDIKELIEEENKYFDDEFCEIQDKHYRESS